MPRSGRVSPRIPPIALGTTLLRSHYSHTHARPLSPRLEGKTRVEGRKLRDHVRTVGKVVLDVAGWERNCDTPRTEDSSATWSGPGSSSFEMSQTTTERSDSNSSNGHLREVPTPRKHLINAPNVREERRESTQLQNSQTWLPFLGIEVTVDRYSTIDGLRVVGVTAGSPSSAAGIRVGDVIKRLNGVALMAKKDLRSALQLLANAPGIHPPVYPSVPAEISRAGSASVVKVHIVPTGKAAIQTTSSVTPRRTRTPSVCLSRRRAPSYTAMSNRRNNYTPRYATSP